MHALIRKLFGKTRSPRSAPPFRRTASLSVEALEKRDLMAVLLSNPVLIGPLVLPSGPAASVSVTSNGVLQISGTDYGDTVSVSLQATDFLTPYFNTNYQVQMNGTTYLVNAMSVTSHLVNFFGRGGTDTFVNNTFLDTNAFGWGDDTFTGGSGVNHLYGGSGNNVLTGGSGFSYLYGGSGSNVLIPGTGGASYDGSGTNAVGNIAVKWRDLGGASVVGWPTTNELEFVLEQQFFVFSGAKPRFPGSKMAGSFPDSLEMWAFPWSSSRRSLLCVSLFPGRRHWMPSRFPKCPSTLIAAMKLCRSWRHCSISMPMGLLVTNS